jgi:hypothetical protein
MEQIQYSNSSSSLLVIFFPRNQTHSLLQYTSSPYQCAVAAYILVQVSSPVGITAIVASPVGYTQTLST